MGRTQKILSIIFITLTIAQIVHGVEQVEPSKRQEVLRILFDSLKSSSNDSISKELNSQITSLLKDELSTPESFTNQYENLKFLGKCESEDKKMRVYTWMYETQNKDYRYGCFVQTKDRKGNITLKQLRMSNKRYVPKPSNTVYEKNWYGALYYKIIPPLNKKDTYKLLGWGKGNPGTEFKVIETISIDKKGNITLGKDNRFNSGKGTFKRIVLQYSDQLSASLAYNKGNKSIIFDHLIPSENVYKGIYSYYGPDFTYDEYKIDKKGIWNLVQNVDARNNE